MSTAMTFAGRWMVATWEVVLEAAPWLLAGFFLAGLLHVWIPVRHIAAHLGGSGLGAVLKAALLGAPLPLCSCSVIPVASALRRRGASRAATAAFLVTTPETGVDSISVTWALLGPVMAVIRPVAAILTAVIAGLAIRRLAPDPPAEASPPDSARPGQPCCGQEAAAGPSSAAPCCCGDAPSPPARRLFGRRALPALVGKTRDALGYGFGTMFADLGHWLALGFVLAGLVSAAVPAGFLEGRLGAGPAGMLLAVLIALPLYVCATASTPIAAALIAKGLSPGTALVFLLVGPATNTTTMVVVARELGKRCLAIYVASIVVVALACGLLTDLLLHPAVGVLPAGLSDCRDCTPGHWLPGIALTALILNGMWTRLARGGWRRADVPSGSVPGTP